MKKLATLCMVALGATLLILGTAPGASAYPDLSCDVSVDAMTVAPGAVVTVVGRVAGADSAKPITWTFRWNGVSKQSSGAQARATFTAPRVKSTRVLGLTGEVKATQAGAPRTCVHHIDITVTAGSAEVLAATATQGGGLPGTGGPALWVLLAALVLLAAGGGTVIATRRRGH